MKQKIILLLAFCFWKCTSKIETPKIYNCKKITLRQYDISQDVHHLILDNYCDECLDDILREGLIRKYLDTVRITGHLNGVFLYSTDENFPKNREYQDFPKINKNLIVGYAFFDEKDSLYKNPTGIYTYMEGKRRYISIPFVPSGSSFFTRP